ncbi:MAG: RluA family pseudouridine synthase [Gammaproteobacteria bacterium]|nr:RluA family pseudouridine synthase [Gammaproteobacteria bacterium]
MVHHSKPYTPPAHTELDMIYQDDDLLVVNKPAWLLSVPGRGEDKQDCMLSRVRLEYPEALVVHRLDMATSGLMLLARNKEMQSKLGTLFEKRQIDKRYIAMVDGKLEHQTGEINQPLITDWPNRPKQKIDHDNGKPSLTSYKVLNYNEEQNTSRVELIPKTGRTHQLRVHLQSIGHAIIGDRLYASTEAQKKSERLLLHAVKLSFIHPVTQQELVLNSNAPF